MRWNASAAVAGAAFVYWNGSNFVDFREREPWWEEMRIFCLVMHSRLERDLDDKGEVAEAIDARSRSIISSRC